MGRVFRARPALTEETQRATTFEIFFDLVFVFALTRIIAFMAQPPTFLALAQGLLLLLLLWFSWSSFVWLGNQARADVGLIRAGTMVAMAALFVAALVTPDAYRHGDDVVDAPLTLAVGYIVVRFLQIVLYLRAAAGDHQLRVTVLLSAVPTGAGAIALILGAVVGGAVAQTLLWVVGFLIGAVGGRIATVFSPWRLRSPSHFAERHGLVLIIALGESLISAGTGAGRAVTRGPVLVAALLGLSVALCLWLLYFENAAPAGGSVLGRAPGPRRGRVAGDAYSLAHFGLVAGILFADLGIEQVLAHVAHAPAGAPGGASLGWAATTALFGGVAAYLVGRAAFLRLTVGSVPGAQVVATVVALALLPAGRVLPALAALGLLAAFLVVLCGYERLRPDRPVAAAREAGLV
jgi:low temperature requirement protein LtrA